MTDPYTTRASSDRLKQRPVLQQFKLVAVAVSGLVLGACSGVATVKTVDNSADYRDARALPPLKKPEQNTLPPQTQSDPAPAVSPSVVAAEPPATQAPAGVDQAEQSIAPIEQTGDSEDSSTLAAPDAQQVEADDALSQDNSLEDVVQESHSEPATTSTADVQVAETQTYETLAVPSSTISARVEPQANATSRLVLDAPFEQAWDYVVRNLQTSDITVFSRNKAAGRFAIGCGDIESAPQVEKRGGWSFINRRKEQQSEYCALQAIERKSTTSLSVLNRSGREVSREYSEAIFNRLLNN